MDKGIEALTPEMARESGNILIIVAARLARKECLTPLHTLSELGQRTISTRALNDAIERAEESLSREAGKIRDGYDRLTKMLRETESALVQAHQESKEQSARIEELESQRSLAFIACNRWRDKCADAEKRIAELEASPNGMMQLSNELAEMKRKCAEFENQKFDTAKLINKFYTRYPLESFKSDPERSEALGYYMAGAEVQHFGDFVVYEMPEDDEGSE